jgi:hypothetical protein
MQALLMQEVYKNLFACIMYWEFIKCLVLFVLSLFRHKLKNSTCGYRTQKQTEYATSVSLLTGEVQSESRDWLPAMKWCDIRDVKLLSTLHSDKTVNTRKRDWKTK